MSIFNTPAPPKAKHDDGTVHSMSPPHDPPKGPPYGPGNIRHVPIPAPARTAGDKR